MHSGVRVGGYAMCRKTKQKKFLDGDDYLIPCFYCDIFRRRRRRRRVTHIFVRLIPRLFFSFSFPRFSFRFSTYQWRCPKRRGSIRVEARSPRPNTIRRSKTSRNKTEKWVTPRHPLCIICADPPRSGFYARDVLFWCALCAMRSRCRFERFFFFFFKQKVRHTHTHSTSYAFTIFYLFSHRVHMSLASRFV